MASDERQPDRAAVRVFPPGVPLAVILAGIGLSHLWPIDPGFELAPPARHWVGGAIVALAVLGLGVWSVVLFRRSGQSENPWKPTPQILERGPFRVTRNPMYLQMLLLCVGVAVMRWDVWTLLLTPLGAWVLRKGAIEPEEAYLERKFGQAYLDYKRRVRRWL